MEDSMTEAASAIISGVALVVFSMIGGGMIFVLAKDYVKRNLRNKE